MPSTGPVSHLPGGAARQLVSHKHFTLNGRRVNIASIRLDLGDEVAVRAQSGRNAYFKQLDDNAPAPSQMPSWLEVDRKKASFKVTGLPVREDVLEEVNEQLLVEYYSR